MGAVADSVRVGEELTRDKLLLYQRASHSLKIGRILATGADASRRSAQYTGC